MTLTAQPTTETGASHLDADHHTYLRRWVNTWVALGSVVALVVIVYLVFISNALATINDNLTATSAAVSGAEGNTKTLPGQLEAINTNLGQVDTALRGLPGQSGRIKTSLGSVATNLVATADSLDGTSGHLVTIAGNLVTTSSTLDTVSSRLSDTSGLLRAVLSSTDGISATLHAVDGAGSGRGIRSLTSSSATVNRSLAGTVRGLGAVRGMLGDVNVHLTNICESGVVNLAHGKQPC